MTIPNTTPAMSEYIEKPSGKMLKHEDTPLYIKDLMQLVRDEGQDTAQGHWDQVVEFLHKISKDQDRTGNDYLSMMGTYLCYFASTWIVMMKKLIADKDEAGVQYKDIVGPICDGIKEIIATSKLEVKSVRKNNIG